eukprot:CAMPEP_0202443638 /NCGR_PEP_ID=MMETSP1360-20130828/2846_1 /ASSEMBLY_ACC=CAM_ASM_000848 /TAXON_ID=515479 /ORGANISM="Licmophora paradoxa, Strain CCMP2313" /LENGTH=431 /DNA_ID=CAMNT_0049059371 /DNA_START=118 /DNA_END=1413 /DNA_ORIENTATION=-
MAENTENLNPIHVTVKDPEHLGEGLSKYTTYYIDIVGRSTLTRRRYSDFQWLYSKLMKERPGAIIPIIPHQRALTQTKRFSDELLAERQKYLTNFLSIVLNHPDLRDAPCVGSFLTADPAQFEVLKKDSNLSLDQHDPEQFFLDSPSTPSTGKKISKFFGKLGASMRKNIALGAGVELEKTPDDDIFEELDAYALQLDNNIKILAKNTATLASVSKSQAETMTQMAAAFSEMGQYRVNDVIIRTSSSTMFTKLGKGWSEVAASTRSFVTAAQLDDQMQNMALDVIALKIAINIRKELLYNYTRKAYVGKTKMAQLEKWKETPPTDMKKVAQTQGEVRLIKEEGLNLWKELDVVSKRLQADVEHFRITFHEKFRSIMEQYVRLQAGYSKKFAQGYDAILPHVAPPSPRGEVIAPPPASAPPAPPKDAETVVI